VEAGGPLAGAGGEADVATVGSWAAGEVEAATARSWPGGEAEARQNGSWVAGGDTDATRG